MSIGPSHIVALAAIYGPLNGTTMHCLRKYLGWGLKRLYKTGENPAAPSRASIDERFLKLMDLVGWLSAIGIVCAMLIFLTVPVKAGELSLRITHKLDARFASGPATRCQSERSGRDSD